MKTSSARSKSEARGTAARLAGRETTDLREPQQWPLGNIAATHGTGVDGNKEHLPLAAGTSIELDETSEIACPHIPVPPHSARDRFGDGNARQPDDRPLKTS